MIRNIAFEATRKELKKLVSKFGKLKKVRLPKKVGSEEHRGFGFAEFVSVEEAKTAFERL